LAVDEPAFQLAGEGDGRGGEMAVGDDHAEVAVVESFSGVGFLDCAVADGAGPAFGLDDHTFAAGGDDEVGTLVAGSSDVLDDVTVGAECAGEESLKAGAVECVDVGVEELVDGRAAGSEDGFIQLRRPLKF
jgi:hypothetical protein